MLERHRSGGLTALVIDEAQSLPHDLLEEVRLLANFETETDKLLPVVLAGQPELASRLEHEQLRQLKQRVALRCDLTPLDIKETASYISGRIAIAGGDSARIFTREAVQTIYERSGGIPRTISVISDNALLTGFAAGVKPVGAVLVLEVCRDFRLPQFKVADLSTAYAGSSDVAPVGEGSDTVPRPPTNGNGGPPPPVVRRPEPTTEGRGQGAEPARRPPDRGMFSHYTKKKRFSFFV